MKEQKLRQIIREEISEEIRGGDALRDVEIVTGMLSDLNSKLQDMKDDRSLSKLNPEIRNLLTSFLNRMQDDVREKIRQIRP